MVIKIIHELRNQARYKDRVEHVEILPIKNPVYGTLQAALPPPLSSYLSKKSIKLYKHQCDAVDALRAGKNVIITTPTASGKTLAFNLPIFEKLSQDTRGTTLYIYPTKALSNDQLKVVKEMERSTKISIHPKVYDGDTPRGKRPRIRERSRIIISNPYELHHTLPWHYKWQKFLTNLKFIVIDEAHQYRGVLGSNIALLIRRFRRMCNYYGSDPQFILCTATLANPIEFAEKLTGLDFELIADDGSPKGPKYFVFYNPYYDEEGQYSTHQETKDLFLLNIKNNLQTLCFTISRKMAELMTLWSRTDLEESEELWLRDKITTYRAGYLPEERREIENKLKMGLLMGVASTNALELGIDIGSLDSVIISGYPGTVISTWQQAGRAGRGTNDSLVTLVAFQDPLDQYFMKHPHVFFGKSHEHAIIDLLNPYIVSGHLMCASAELPITLDVVERYFGEELDEAIEELVNQGLIRNTSQGWVYSGIGRATEAVQLNTISSEIFKVICNGELIETLDKNQAYREAHKNAVLLHQGETYIVVELDLENSIVQVMRKNVDYYTQAMKTVDVRVQEEIEKKEIGEFIVHFGNLEVTEQYIGYKIMKYDQVTEIESLELPPLKFNTMGLWITIPGELEERIWGKRKDCKESKEPEFKKEVFLGSLHGTEHAMIGIMPFHVMCDRRDIGGMSTPNHLDTLSPTIFIYDGFDGGIGLTEKAYELIHEIVKMTYELVKDCKCTTGCPSCIYSPKCGNENMYLDKNGTITLLEELLRRGG